MKVHSSPQQLKSAGQRLYAAGEFAAAAEQFAAAAGAYREAGEPLEAAELENNRCVALLQVGRGEEALEVVEGTPELFEEAGDRKRQAIALANCGAALEEVGEKERAADDYLRSAEILEDLGEDQLRTEVMKSLSALQLRDRNPLGALLSMRRGLEGEGKRGPVRRLLKKLLDIPFNLLSK